MAEKGGMLIIIGVAGLLTVAAVVGLIPVWFTKENNTPAQKPSSDATIKVTAKPSQTNKKVYTDTHVKFYFRYPSNLSTKKAIRDNIVEVNTFSRPSGNQPMTVYVYDKPVGQKTHTEFEELYPVGMSETVNTKTIAFGSTSLKVSGTTNKKYRSFDYQRTNGNSILVGTYFDLGEHIVIFESPQAEAVLLNEVIASMTYPF